MFRNQHSSDSKDTKSYQAPVVDEPPPYSEGAASSTLEIPAISGKPKSTECSAISSREAVNLTGMLNVHGDIKSSSHVSLADNVGCQNISCGGDLTLSNGCFVGGLRNYPKVKADGNVTVLGGVSGIDVWCRMEAGGNMAIYGGVGDFTKKAVTIRGRLDAGGDMLLDGNELPVRVEGKVKCDGDTVLKGNIDIVGDVESDGKISIITELGSNGLFKVGGKMRGKGGVFVVGNLEVEGDLVIKADLHVQGFVKVLGSLTVKGDVLLAKGSALVVNGKKSISGTLKEN